MYQLKHQEIAYSVMTEVFIEQSDKEKRSGLATLRIRTSGKGKDQDISYLTLERATELLRQINEFRKTQSKVGYIA